MASARLTDYLGFGPLYNRPSSPSLNADTLGLWYDTESQTLSAWDGAVWSDVGGLTSLGCSAYNDGAQSIGDAVATAILFGAEDWDTAGLHSTSVNTSRFTIPAGFDGKWSFSYGVSFPANATGIRSAVLRKNGGSDTNDVVGSATFGVGTSATLTSLHAQRTVELVEGDYIELYAYQSSGGALNTGDSLATNRGNVNFLEAVFLG